MKLAQSFLVKPVPDVDESIGAPRGERVVMCVEGDGIHWIYLLHAILFDSVTLKCIFPFLYLWTWIKIFYSYSSYKKLQDSCIQKFTIFLSSL